MNRMLVTVKAEEILTMVQNVTIPYIEVEGNKDGNLHAFEIVNTDWVPKNSVLRKLVISEARRMTTKYFLRHRLPF